MSRLLSAVSVTVFPLSFSAGIVSRFPTLLKQLSSISIQADLFIKSLFLVVIVCFLLMIAYIVFMDNSERRLPISYAKRVVGRKMMGGQSTHMPIKVNMSGVLPVIFASSILSLPGTVQMFLSADKYEGTFWESL